MLRRRSRRQDCAREPLDASLDQVGEIPEILIPILGLLLEWDEVDRRYQEALSHAPSVAHHA